MEALTPADFTRYAVEFRYVDETEWQALESFALPEEAAAFIGQQLPDQGDGPMVYRVVEVEDREAWERAAILSSIGEGY